MSNLFTALNSAASAISVFEQALTVSQNNIANNATPGYAKQISSFQALPFDAAGGLSGGVTTGPVENARNTFAETSVQQASTSLGNWQEQVTTLQGLQSSFDTTGSAGIPGALNQLYSAFTSWGAAPNDPTTQQSVLTAAQTVAQAFKQQSTEISSAASTADTQLGALVSQVNQLTAKIRDDNVNRDGGQDPSVQADLYSNLQQLSQLVPITAFTASDGSTSVLLAGQTPLVVGANQYNLTSQTGVPANPPATNPGGPPLDQILDSTGNDVTSAITSGQIGGLLQARNGTLAYLQGSPYQQGALNQLAQGIADRVNGLLTGGNISAANAATGAPAVPGVALFTYGTTASAAQTLSVNPAITPGQLAAIDPGPPQVNNGIALKLANLATPQNPADEINNLSYSQFYGGIAGQLGSAIATAQANQTSSQEQVTQATTLRQQTSGVDLNQEAVNVLQFQQSYNAAAKMVSVIDSLTATILNAVTPLPG